MSSDGTRKQTRGWDISPSGKMINLVDSEDVAIEEPPSAPVAATAAAAPAPMELRPRRSTLETFNDEMSVLERPIEGEVEYEDPPPSRLKRAALFVGIVAIVGVGGGFAMSRRYAASAPVAETPASAAATVAAATAAPPAPAKPEPTILAAAAPAAAAEASAAAGDEAADEDSAQPAPSSHGAWDKVKSKSGHGKHSRSTSGKRAQHSSSKHVAGKHGSSRHH